MVVANDLVRLANTQVGVHEGRTNGHWDNREKYAGEVPGLEWANGQPWCATFVSWVALKGGAAELFPRTASCDVALAWFRSRGQFSEYPSVGAQVFYGTLSDSVHTGIVTGFDDTYVFTVEGNTNDSGSREGDGVYAKRRLRRDPYIVGYGVPRFPAEPAKAPQKASWKPEGAFQTRLAKLLGRTNAKQTLDSARK